MSIWSDATINRFTADGEIEIATAVKCIIARTALASVAGTATYSLPADALFVTRVTWLGKGLDPMPAKDYHLFDNVTSQTRPLWYVFNQQGRNVIRFHPVPGEAISSTSTDLWGADIEDHVIVEYYQLPNGTTVTIPAYIRRRLLKLYVLANCFSIEGPGQNLKSAKKFFERFKFYLEHFTKVYAGVFISKTPVLGNASRSSVLAPPHLSYDKFGEGVDY